MCSYMHLPKTVFNETWHKYINPGTMLQMLQIKVAILLVHERQDGSLVKRKDVNEKKGGNPIILTESHKKSIRTSSNLPDHRGWWIDDR